MSNKAKNKLEDLNIVEISMTDESQGGPASEMETILLKNKCKEDLTPDQLEMIERYGEEFTPLYKQQSNEDSPSSVEGDAGEETNVTKGNEEPMSDKQEDVIKAKDDEIAELRKQLETKEVEELKKSLEKYSFKDVDSVVEVLKGLEKEDKEVITKSFDNILSEQENFEKIKDKQIEKEFGEAGEDGEAEVEEELDLNARIKKQLNKESK